MMILRPEWYGTVGYQGPSRAQLMEKIVKNPVHLTRHISQFLELKKARHWEMPRLDIFAVAAARTDVGC